MLTIALQAVRTAGDIVVQSLERTDTLKVTEKAHNDFVSEVDQKVERKIIRAIQKVYPSHSFLAEESGRIDGDEYTWIIDPLDGTTNFLRQIPHFAISVALQHRNRTDLGIIYDPIKQELFTAERGKGAKLNDRRLRVSPSTTLSGAVIATGFPFRELDSQEQHVDIIRAFCPEIAAFRRTGSAALDLAYVAAKRFDGFWDLGLKPWDVAAGALLVKEAGGLVTDCQGSENYLHGEEIVAANPKLLRAMLGKIHHNNTFGNQRAMD